MGALEEDVGEDEEQGDEDSENESESLHQATANAYNDGFSSSQQSNNNKEKGCYEEESISVAEESSRQKIAKNVDKEQMSCSETDNIPQDRVSRSPSTDSDDDNEEEETDVPSLLIGKATKRGKKRSSLAETSIAKVTLAHPSSHTHYSDSSEDEYEFN